jgi:hypothetical protein
LAAFSGGLAWAVLASAGAVAVPVAIGIGAAVLVTKVAIGAVSNRAPRAAIEQAHDRLPEAPRNSAQFALVARARRAVQRIADLSDRPSDTWLRDETAKVVIQSRTVLDSLVDLGGRVTVLDSSVEAANPQALAGEISRLQHSLAATTDPDVRADQNRALAALDSQSESIARLLRRRESLLAQMQAAAVGLEGLAARTGELVALGTTSYRNDEAVGIVTEMSSSLDTMREGMDEARRVLRDM